MKNGRTLTELAIELDRQRNAKHDYLLDTRNITMNLLMKAIRLFYTTALRTSILC